jgi:pimeloyl-ACP methyl ester carboxylesterase
MEAEPKSCISVGMLPYSSRGTERPTLVMMPFLGGSQTEWTEVVDVLSVQFQCVTVDLPGFGAATDIGGYSVQAMADQVIDTLRLLDASDYVLVGHSMAGKVGAVVSRRLVEVCNIPGPQGLVLVSPSPPSPEPITEEKRTEMLALFGSEPRDGDFTAALHYVADNTSVPLTPEKAKRTADGVVAMNRAAWKGWLEQGSKEDWADYVGRIDLPALIVAGKSDKSLGPQAQRKLTLPHFLSSELVELDCSHLAPLERPNDLALALRNFVSAIKAGSMSSRNARIHGSNLSRSD